MMKITLHGRYAEGRAALVDNADHALVAGTRWYRTKTGYCWGRVSGRMTLLHRYLGAVSGTLIDHINGDRLDCRRENLRAATAGQNKANSRRRADSGLPYKGVERLPSGRYRAVLTVAGRRQRSPTYDLPAEAALAYDALARAAWLQYAGTNFVPVRVAAAVRWVGVSRWPDGLRSADAATSAAADRQRVVAEIETN